MLKQRLLTAIVLIPLVLWAIFGLPTRQFAIALGFVVAIGAWEWSRLCGFATLGVRFIYTLFIGLLIALLFALEPNPVLFHSVLGLAAIWWAYSFVLVMRYQGHGEGESLVQKALAGPLVLVPAWLSLVMLHGYKAIGPQLVIFLMLLIWTADTGAYFVGRRWGSRKLAPKVSPGKSWEGVMGAFLFSAILALAGGAWLGETGFALAAFVIVCLVTVVFSIIGDLTESLVKRQVGVKDSGNILPGHGGVLDRIDSMTAAAPIFAFGLWLMEIAT